MTKTLETFEDSIQTPQAYTPPPRDGTMNQEPSDFVYPENPCAEKDSYAIYDNAYHCIPKGTKHSINNPNPHNMFCNVYSGNNRIIAQGVSNTVNATNNVLWKIGTDSSATCSGVETLKAY